MTDSSIQKAEVGLSRPPEGPEERLQSWLKDRDRMGALVEWHAALDDALARGYANGLVEGRSEGLDAARTMLLRMLESKFGDLNESLLEKIAEAKHPALQKYMLSILAATCAENVFAEG